MTFAYLASPYSRQPDGRRLAFIAASRAAGLLLKHGIKVFSPIAHTHPIAEHYDEHLGDAPHEFWMAVDKPFMETASSLIVLELDGWQESAGVAEEIAAFKKAGKPIYHMRPGVIPPALLRAA